MKNTSLLLLIISLFGCRPTQKVPESTTHLPLTDLVLKQAYEIVDGQFEGVPIDFF